jgi:hypothetical protein
VSAGLLSYANAFPLPPICGGAFFDAASLPTRTHTHARQHLEVADGHIPEVLATTRTALPRTALTSPFRSAAAAQDVLSCGDVCVARAPHASTHAPAHEDAGAGAGVSESEFLVRQYELAALNDADDGVKAKDKKEKRLKKVRSIYMWVLKCLNWGTQISNS